MNHTDTQEAIFWKIHRGELPLPPAARLLSLEVLAVEPQGGAITLAFEAPPAFSNPTGKVQGGFLSAMLDETMGTALLSTLGAGEFAPTLEMKVQFVAGANPGRLTGHGRVVSRGGRIAFMAGELHQGDVLIATATATALIRRVG